MWHCSWVASTLPTDQAAAISGIGAELAAAGAVTGETGHPVSMLLGGSLGIGGGYVIGLRPEKLDEQARDIHREEALRANDCAERNPAGVEDVVVSPSADVNADGFVTVDEIIAMERAGLSDKEEIARLKTSGQVFKCRPSRSVIWKTADQLGGDAGDRANGQYSALKIPATPPLPSTLSRVLLLTDFQVLRNTAELLSALQLPTATSTGRQE